MQENGNKYTNISELTKNTYIKNNLEFKKDLEIKKRQNKMIVKLINDSIKTDNIVEFGDILYVDNNNLITTISQEFAIGNKTATIVTPRVKENIKFGNLTIFKTSIDNPFGDYGDIITTNSLKLIKEAKCFIVTADFPRLDKHFKAWAGIGIPCIYAISGKLNKELKEKDDEIRNKMEKMKTNFIDLDVNFSYDKKSNTTAKIYILKR